MRALAVLNVRPESSTPLSSNSAPPDRWPLRLMQNDEHASACAAIDVDPGPQSMNVCANAAALFAAPDVNWPLLPRKLVRMLPPALSNKFSVQFVTRSVAEPAEAAAPTTQLGCGNPGQTPFWPNVGFCPSATVGTVRSATPTASHACVIARSAALLEPNRSRAA